MPPPPGPIYLDHQATTPVDPRVMEAMAPYFTAHFGNAASRTHAFGWHAEGAVKKARAQVAEILGADPAEIVFTSGATESNNLAIKGALEANREKGHHLVTVATEHKAVLDPFRRLEREAFLHREELQRLRLEELLGRHVERSELEAVLAQHPLDDDSVLERWSASSRTGARITVLPVEADGRVSLEALEASLTPETVLVSVMLANNETGVLQPVNDIGALCRARGILFHCDASQGIGKVPFDVESAQADLVSFTAHKLYGPKGVGALYVRRKPRARILAQLDGGGHERGMRSGTLPVPLVVGFGEACALAAQERDTEAARLTAMRNRLREGLQKGLTGVHFHGTFDARLPGNLSVGFEGVEAEGLLLALRDIALSAGSACTSASLEPSYVLRAMGVDATLARGSIRIGLGRFNTDAEIDYTLETLISQVTKLRGLMPRTAAASGK